MSQASGTARVKVLGQECQHGQNAESEAGRVSHVGRMYGLKMNLGPCLYISFPSFCSSMIHFLKPHYGLASFKCIWNEISNINSVVKCKDLVSLWFLFTERYLWISGEDMRILIVLIFFFLVWPHYVNFPIVLGYENIKAITHLYEVCARGLSWKPGGTIHIGLSKLNNPC